MGWDEWIRIIVSLIVGAAIGVGVDLFMRKRDDRLRKERFAAALMAEVTAFLKRYKQAIGDHIDNASEDKPLGFFARISGNYFQVFDSMCSDLGLLDPCDAEMVISFCTNAKGYTDTLRLYEDLSGKRPGGVIVSAIDRSILLKYSNTIRREHKQIQSQGKELVLRLTQLAAEGHKPWWKFWAR